MAKLEKLKMMMDLRKVTEYILVCNKGEEDEFYIDSRTTRNEQGLYKVKPIAENNLFMWYVCPFCQQIHIESKRCLNVTNKVLWANCKYRRRMVQYIVADCELDPIAHQEVEDTALESEYKFMQSFES